MTNFKIDTGAGVTVIPLSLYDPTQDGELKPINRKLVGPSQQILLVCGQITATINKNGKDEHENIYVVKGLKNPLLGRDVQL